MEPAVRKCASDRLFWRLTNTMRVTTHNMSGEHNESYKYNNCDEHNKQKIIL